MLLTALFMAAAPAMADEPGYKLHIDSSVAASRLSVTPVIAAPAGSRLRVIPEATISASQRIGAPPSNALPATVATAGL